MDLIYYKNKYLRYKAKYLQLHKQIIGGANPAINVDMIKAILITCLPEIDSYLEPINNETDIKRMILNALRIHNEFIRQLIKTSELDCGKNRILQVLGTCWFSAAINALILPRFIKLRIQKFIRDYVEIQQREPVSFIEQCNQNINGTLIKLSDFFKKGITPPGPLDANTILWDILSLLCVTLYSDGILSKKGEKQHIGFLGYSGKKRYDSANNSVTNIALSVRTLGLVDTNIDNSGCIAIYGIIQMIRFLNRLLPLPTFQIRDIPFELGLDGVGIQTIKSVEFNPATINVLYFVEHEPNNFIITPSFNIFFTARDEYHTAYDYGQNIFIRGLQIQHDRMLYHYNYIQFDYASSYTLDNIENLDFLIMVYKNDFYNPPQINRILDMVITINTSIYYLQSATINVYMTGDKDNSHVIMGFICNGHPILYDSASNSYINIDWTNLEANYECLKALFIRLYNFIGEHFKIDVECAIYSKNYE